MTLLRESLAGLPDYDPRDLSDDGITIRLHRNESALPPPESVLEALRTMQPEVLRTYPTALQRAVIERIALRFNREPGAVALAAGADEILAACARAVLEPGDEALTVSPTFGMYGRVVALAGGVLRRVPYQSRWRIDVASLIAAATPRTRLVILGHPNNPTGEALRASDLSAISRALPNALILVDEVYLALSQRSLAQNAAARFENVAIAGSFSKCAALAGVRVGYLLASPRIAGAIRRSFGPFPVSAPSLVAANAYLRDPARTRAFETQLEAQVARSLDAFEAALRPFSREIWRGPANFLLADCAEKAAPLREGLASRGIGVRTFDDPMLAGTIRICAADDDTTAIVATAIRELAAREVTYA